MRVGKRQWYAFHLSVRRLKAFSSSSDSYEPRGLPFWKRPVLRVEDMDLDRSRWQIMVGNDEVHAEMGLILHKTDVQCTCSCVPCRIMDDSL